MPVTRSILFFILLSINSSCKSQSKEPGENKKVKDEFTSITTDCEVADSIPYYYHDSIGNMTYVTVRKGDTAKLLIYEPTMLFRAEKGQRAFLINPGNNYTIQKIKRSELYFKDNNDTSKSIETNFFKELHDSTGEFRYWPLSAIKKKRFQNLNELEIFLAKIHDKRNNFLGRNLDVIKDANARSFIHQFIYWVNLNDYFEVSKNYLDTNRQQQIIRDLNDHSSSDLNVFSFRLCAIHSLMAQTGRKQFETKDFDLIVKIYKGDLKNFMLTFLLNYFAKSNNKPAFNALIDRYRKESSNSTYAHFIDFDYFESEKDNVNFEDLAIDLNNKKKAISSIFKTSGSKLTLVDFWASWCVPCIGEFVQAKKLKSNYDESDFSILYISMDQDASAWLKFNKLNPDLMKINNSFKLQGNFQSVFATKNKINSIPRYMILGKDGEIVNNDAPRPSDPKLIPLLNELLEK